MKNQIEEFVPENLKPAPARYRPLNKAGGGGFVPSTFDFVAQFFGLLTFALLLICIGWLVANACGGTAFAIWLASVIVGLVVIEIKSQEKLNVFWPALLGPIGLIVLLVLPNLEKEAKLKSAAEVDRSMRAEELRVQKEILAELQAARSKNVPPSPGS